MEQQQKQKQWIRLIYLYLFACIGLIIVVTGCIQGINVGLKTFVFKNADRYVIHPQMKEEKNDQFAIEQEMYTKAESRRQRELDTAGALSMIVVGFPLYLYHWKLVQKEQKG